MPENTELHAKSMPETPKNQPFCFLNIRKPKGITSFDVIYRLRKRLGIKKIGHSGTLDPLAEGVMQVAVGGATRLIDYLGSDKKYIARIKFGFFSSTGDAEGEITRANVPNFTYQQLLDALNSLTGDIVQVPPIYSAIKVGGKKLCDIARKLKPHAGSLQCSKNPENQQSAYLNTVEPQKIAQNNAPNPDIVENLQSKIPEIPGIQIPARNVKIYSAEILSPVLQSDLQSKVPDEIDIEIYCSKGTYIRSFAVDLAALLGTGAYLTALNRTMAGNFTIENAVNIDDVCLARDAINPAAAIDLPKYFLDEAEYKKVLNGMPVYPVQKLEKVQKLQKAQKAQIAKAPMQESGQDLEMSNRQTATPQIMLIFDEKLVSIGVLEDNKIRCKKVFASRI